MFSVNVNQKAWRWGAETGLVINREWLDVFAFNHITKFSDLWDLKADWYEEPNYRRGGWSGVVRVELRYPNGKSFGIFLKRQQNHNTRTLAHPIKGSSTFFREWNNLCSFRNNNIPSLTPLLYAEIKTQAKAILITKELNGYQSLETFMQKPGATLNPTDRQILLEQIASAVACMHDNGYRHGSLYPKHLFVRTNWQANGSNFAVCFIDLEKTRFSYRRSRTIALDLGQLQHRCQFFSQDDWNHFLNTYFEQRAGLPSKSRDKLILQIQCRSNRPRRSPV